MMNAPTKSEIPANTRSAMLKNASASLMSEALDSAACAPVFASNAGGRACWMRSRRIVGVTPGSAATSISSNSPPPFNAICAEAGSKATRVAPARLSAVPNRKTPTIVSSWGGPSRSTRTRSPTAKSCLRAVPASIAISPGACGACPCAIASEESWGSFTHDTPSVGAPPVVIAFPSLPTSWA